MIKSLNSGNITIQTIFSRKKIQQGWLHFVQINTPKHISPEKGSFLKRLGLHEALNWLYLLGLMVKRILEQKDQQILSGLLAGGHEEKKSLQRLYEDYLPKIQLFVQQNNGSAAEGKDIFQEGVLALYKQVKQGKFRGESALGTYLFGICRYLWYHRLKKQGKKAAFEAQSQADDSNSQTVNPYHQMHRKESLNLVEGLFDQLQYQCKEVLMQALYFELPMDEIAQKMQFENAQVARNKKYKCLKRLRKLLDEKPALQAQLRSLSASF